jgi:hypothetical protein
MSPPTRTPCTSAEAAAPRTAPVASAIVSEHGARAVGPKGLPQSDRPALAPSASPAVMPDVTVHAAKEQRALPSEAGIEKGVRGRWCRGYGRCATAASCDAQRRNVRYGGVHGEDSPGYSGVVSGYSRVLSGTLRYCVLNRAPPRYSGVLAARAARAESEEAAVAKEHRHVRLRMGQPAHPITRNRPPEPRSHACMHALALPCNAEQLRASAASAAIELAGGSQRGTPNTHQTNRPRAIVRTNNQTANSHPPAPPVPRTHPSRIQHARARSHTHATTHACDTHRHTLAHSPRARPD